MAAHGARRFGLLLAAGCLLLLVLLVLHIVVGTVDLSPQQVLAALLDDAEVPMHRQVVWELRLPRALVALMAGGMLGLSGALLQTVTRNPLADPGLLGVSTGGVLAVVAWIVLGPELRVGNSRGDAGLLLPALAFVGGLTTGLAVYLIAGRGSSSGVRLVLTGVLVGSICSALTSVLLLWAEEQSVMRIVRWTIGSTSGRVWLHWHTIWPFALLAIPLGLGLAGVANVLQLGDAAAAGLGLHVERARLLLLAAATLLTAAAVAVVGAVGFVGLVGPHLARRLAGGDVRRLFVTSVLVTAALLLVADIVARTLTIGWVGGATGVDIPDTAGLPVGAVTALLGAPFFLYLLLRPRS